MGEDRQGRAEHDGEERAEGASPEEHGDANHEQACVEVLLRDGVVADLGRLWCWKGARCE